LQHPGELAVTAAGFENPTACESEVVYECPGLFALEFLHLPGVAVGHKILFVKIRFQRLGKLHMTTNAALEYFQLDRLATRGRDGIEQPFNVPWRLLIMQHQNQTF
jgi:hypothetical protein